MVSRVSNRAVVIHLPLSNDEFARKFVSRFVLHLRDQRAAAGVGSAVVCVYVAGDFGAAGGVLRRAFLRDLACAFALANTFLPRRVEGRPQCLLAADRLRSYGR